MRPRNEFVAPTAPAPSPFKIDAVSAPAPPTDAPVEGALAWTDLNETEKSAASLGVDPSAWKPIAFVNESHYDTLLKSNAIDGDLAKKLEAHRAVASGVA